MENILNLKQINIKAIEICSILQKHNYQAYIVGGCVRDLILNQIPKDFDITTNATPDAVMKLFPETYATGLKHGTITVSMGKGIENHFEVTTFRIEGKYLDGRRPEDVTFVTNIIDDLSRRDLTINAMAFDPISHTLLDPFNGENDLKNNIIKAVGNANERFREDGLRIMRAARFAARFNYEIEESTLEAMQNNIDTLLKVSKERIKDELCKILMTDNPYYGINILQKLGILKNIIPSLIPNRPSTHFLPSLDFCIKNLETRVACLFANVMVNTAKEDLISLKFSNSEIKSITFLLDMLDKVELFDKDPNIINYRQFIAFVKNGMPDTWSITLEHFINLTQAIQCPIGDKLMKYNGEIVWARRDLKINGNDLIELGITAGPELKKILDNCYQEILINPENNIKEYLIQFVYKLNSNFCN